jgi:hypothetical protein
MKRSHDDITNGDVKAEALESTNAAAAAAAALERRRCPYLDTINRHVLDFDFEKVGISCKEPRLRCNPNN